jgi:hypothetical protein
MGRKAERLKLGRKRNGGFPAEIVRSCRSWKAIPAAGVEGLI